MCDHDKSPPPAAGASAHGPRSEQAGRSKFRVQAARHADAPEPPEGGTPNGGNPRVLTSAAASRPMPDRLEAEGRSADGVFTLGRGRPVARRLSLEEALTSARETRALVVGSGVLART